MKKEQVFEKVFAGYSLLFRVVLPRLDAQRIFGENRLVAGSVNPERAMHLYRQYPAEEVHDRINAISNDKDFLEICDYYDKNVMPEGMGSFRRAGIFAVAEKL